MVGIQPEDKLDPVVPSLRYAAHQDLLINRHGQPNADSSIECEVNVGSDWRDHYEDWVRSMTGGDVTAQGRVGR